MFIAPIHLNKFKSSVRSEMCTDIHFAPKELTVRLRELVYKHPAPTELRMMGGQ